MWIMVVYILIVLVGETITVAIGLVLDRIFPSASLTVSLTLFFAILWLAWVLAVRLTEPKNAKTAKQSLHESDARRRVHRYSSPLSMKLGLAPRSNTLLDFKKLNEGATRHSQFHCETSLMKPAGERFE